MAELFLDTSYPIALSSPADQYHARAVALAQQIEAQQRRLLTTRAVMLEIGTALAKSRYRAKAVRLLQAMEQDPAVEIVPLSEELYARAMRLYRERPDKEWGLIPRSAHSFAHEVPLQKPLNSLRSDKPVSSEAPHTLTIHANLV